MSYDYPFSYFLYSDSDSDSYVEKVHLGCRLNVALIIISSNEIPTHPQQIIEC